jgi:cation diffusion facilitator CzcD-associated flavoprotein CzcO
MDRCDVAIVGAGPYGLSAAAHLSHVPGLQIRLFGEPMSFWAQHMPEEMCLRSPWAASHLSDPNGRLSLEAFRELQGNGHVAAPIRAVDFIRYGRWFHEQVGLAPEPHKVMRIGPAANGYRLHLEDGNALHARRVVVAGGIQPFTQRPAAFSGLPASLVTHSSEQRDFHKFGGKDVLVIGCGTSALEAAGFMNKAGARTELVMRGPGIRWPRQWLHESPVWWMFYGKGDVGPALMSLVIQRPTLFRRLPRQIQTWWGRRAIRPSALPRLKPTIDGVTLTAGLSPVRARVQGERLRVWLSDGTERIVDHVVLGTGYRVDVRKYPFLGPDLLGQLDTVDGYPRLDAGFETSCPALHFLGAPAAWSFGPLMRFVAGTEFSARALAQRVAETGPVTVGARGASYPPDAESPIRVAS